MTPSLSPIERTLPKGEIDRKGVVLDGIGFQRTISVRFPIDPANGIGTNYFRVEVDFPNGVIDEIDPTTNNIVASFSTEIQSSEIFPDISL